MEKKMRYYLTCLAAFFIACQDSSKTIALILPVEAPAMIDIQDGFVSELKKSHPNYKILIKKGLGDPNIMQSILKSLDAQKVPYVATVGVSLTKAAQNLCKNAIIFGLAAYGNFANKSTYVVEDEIGPETLYKSLITIFPNMKKITLIHAQDDKIFGEVRALQTLMKQGGKELQCLPIINSNDLQTVCEHISGEAILILKDLTVVSGLDLLIKKARQLNIALIVCDEGSVKAGANYAFGVSECEIGKQGADMVAAVIDGQKIPHVHTLAPTYLVSERTPEHLKEQIYKGAGQYNVRVVN